MDFHSLNRRQLQSLCKLNKIPANITNVAMADALQSLQSVEGIEEFLNPVPSETAELPNEMHELMSPATGFRTSVRTKVKKTYAEFVPATTTRGVKKQVAGGENDGLKTKAVASTRKKASETSSCKTMATQDTVKKEVTTVQRAYSTRRSTRLTEKKCAETGLMDRKSSQPVKIGSFLEEEVSGNLVSEKSLGSDTSHESDISSENTKISVAEGSVESIPKEKVEDICNMFDNVDLEETQNEGDEFVLNKVDNSEEVNAYVGSDEHSDSLLSDKASFVLESNPSDTPSSELEDMSYVVLEMKNESLESSGSTNMGGDFIHLNYENLSELSKWENPDSSYVAKEVTEEGMDFGPPAEEHVNISKSQVDAILVDFLNPKESSMSFEDPAEEEKEEFAVDMDADKAMLESEADNANDAVDHSIYSALKQQTIRDDPTLLKGMTKKEEFAVDMDADKATVESEADNANDAVDHSIHLSAMKQQTIRDDPTLLKGMTKNDNDENSVTDLQDATVEDNTAEEDKPKCVTELKLLVDFPNPKELSMNFKAPAEEEKEDTAVDMDADKATLESAGDNANDAVDHSIHLSAMKQQTIRDDPTLLKGMPKNDNDENSVTDLQDATLLIGMTKNDNDENSVTDLQDATVEDNKAEEDKPKCITELSLRQLKKQLKALTIKSNSNINKDDMVAEERPALQAVCDNQMVTGEDH